MWTIFIVVIIVVNAAIVGKFTFSNVLTSVTRSFHQFIGHSMGCKLLANHDGVLSRIA